MPWAAGNPILRAAPLLGMCLGVVGFKGQPPWGRLAHSDADGLGFLGFRSLSLSDAGDLL